MTATLVLAGRVRDRPDPRESAASPPATPGAMAAHLSASRASGFPRLQRFGEDLALAWLDVAPGRPSRLRFQVVPADVVPKEDGG